MQPTQFLQFPPVTTVSVFKIYAVKKSFAMLFLEGYVLVKCMLKKVEHATDQSIFFFDEGPLHLSSSKHVR